LLRMVVGRIVRIRNFSNKGVTFSFQVTSQRGLHAHIGNDVNGWRPGAVAGVKEMDLPPNCDLSSDVVVPFLGCGTVYLKETAFTGMLAGSAQGLSQGVYITVGPSPEDSSNNYLLISNADRRVVKSYKLGCLENGWKLGEKVRQHYGAMSVSLIIKGPEKTPLPSRVSAIIMEDGETIGQNNPKYTEQKLRALMEKEGLPLMVYKKGNIEEEQKQMVYDPNYNSLSFTSSLLLQIIEQKEIEDAILDVPKFYLDTLEHIQLGEKCGFAKDVKPQTNSDKDTLAMLKFSDGEAVCVRFLSLSLQVAVMNFLKEIKPSCPIEA